MGPGEDYWDEWTGWYRKLGAVSKREYHNLWPEPESWLGFYVFMDTGVPPCNLTDRKARIESSPTPPRPRKSSSSLDRVPEWIRLLLGISMVSALLALCFLIPAFVGSRFGPWVGLASSIVAVSVWAYLVRPSPGLVAGAVSLAGLAALIGHSIAWAISSVQMFLS